jgi:hypothetical protein
LPTGAEYWIGDLAASSTSSTAEVSAGEYSEAPCDGTYTPVPHVSQVVDAHLDLGHEDAAQKYCLLGFQLAVEADPHAHAAFMMRAVAHQALSLKQPSHCLDLSDSGGNPRSRTFRGPGSKRRKSNEPISDLRR